MSIRFNEIIYSRFIICLAILFFVSYVYAQKCDQPLKEARFNCHPEDNPTEDTCRARKCCWQAHFQKLNLTSLDDPGVPFCYYPSDFVAYEMVSNETTEFGERFRITKYQKAFMPKDVANLTVDLFYETQQRFRIRIYDPVFRRYQVPLPVPVVQKKAADTDYEVEVTSKPFAIIVTRKSTGATL
jgi:hypothetical protein